MRVMDDQPQMLDNISYVWERGRGSFLSSLGH